MKLFLFAVLVLCGALSEASSRVLLLDVLSTGVTQFDRQILVYENGDVVLMKGPLSAPTYKKRVLHLSPVAVESIKANILKVPETLYLEDKDKGNAYCNHTGSVSFYVRTCKNKIVPIYRNEGCHNYAGNDKTPDEVEVLIDVIRALDTVVSELRIQI